MISLKESTFLSNRSVCVARRRVSPVKVSVGSNGRATEQNGGVLVESPLKEIKEVASVVEVESDYVEEVLEDTPFASGYTLLRDPHHNKGLAFTEKERQSHYLVGLLPPTLVPQDLQLPLSLLKTAQGHPMLVELKNGETYNGHLVNCDTWMNIHLVPLRMETSFGGCLNATSVGIRLSIFVFLMK